jgi:hypothetical protein
MKPEPVPLPNTRCPLCGEPNGCEPSMSGSFRGECWCTQISIARHVLARIPEAQRNLVCLCRRCATGGADADVKS